MKGSGRSAAVAVIVGALGLVLVGIPPRGASTSCAVCHTCPPDNSAGYCAPETSGFEQICSQLSCEGMGVAFVPCAETTGCPSSEAPRCDDGVNNDAWLDELTDCADPDCSSVSPCLVRAPAMGTPALLATALASLALGIRILNRRTTLTPVRLTLSSPL